MRINKITLNNMIVTAYNDSNVEWVVQGGGHTPHRFPKNKFTMKKACEFYIEIFESVWEH